MKRTTKWELGTHMAYVDNDDMAPAYRAGEWVGVTRTSTGLKGRDWIFTDDTGGWLLAHLLGWSADVWRVGLYKGSANPTVRRLSRRRWRATWRIRSSHRHGSEYYDAVAVGDMARADIIARALGGLCPMPPPLPSREGIPRIFALPDRA
jgi:hypothetical protein